MDKANSFNEYLRKYFGFGKQKAACVTIGSKTRGSNFLQKFSHLTDQQWLEVLIQSTKQPIIDSVELPGFPSDEIQSTYTGSCGEHTLREAFDFYRQVKNYAAKLGVGLGSSTRILDFGCGWGRIIRFFLKDVFSDNLYGIDVDPSMIEICQTVVKYGNYCVCNPLPPTEFSDNSFDIIYAYSVFSHLAEPVHIQWLAEFSRILKPGGLLLATTRPRYFIEFCRSLRGKKHSIVYYDVLAKSFIDTERVLADYDNGKFLYSATGGGPTLPSSFYGEAVIPRAYIEKEWTKYLEFKDFLDQTELPDQALIVMKKPNAVVSKIKVEELMTTIRQRDQFPKDSKMSEVLQLKELNARMAALQLLTHDYSFETMPQWVSFATTTFCNLRCLHCQTHGTEEARSVYNKQKWSDKTLSRVAKESLPWAYEFCLTLNGEPLCTPRLNEKLKELSLYGAKLHITTNGTLFSKELLSKLLPLAGSVDISIDGATKFTYEAIRKGANFKKVLNNIRLLTRTCELLPETINPKIGLAFTVMGSTIKEMPEMVRLAYVLKVSRVDFYPLIVFFPFIRGEDLSLHKSLYNAYYERTRKEAECLNVMVTMPDPFPDTEANDNVPAGVEDLIIKQLPHNYYKTLPSPESFLDYSVIEEQAAETLARIKQQILDTKAATGGILVEELQIQMQDSFKTLLDCCKQDLKRLARNRDEKIRYCDNLFRRAFINIEGDVTPCCVPKRPVFGNIYKNTIKEIWNSDLYNDFRKNFYSSRLPDCCKGCRFITYEPRQVFLRLVHRFL